MSKFELDDRLKGRGAMQLTRRECLLNHNYTRDPLLISRELIRPVTLAGDPDAIHAHVDFDVVLEPL